MPDLSVYSMDKKVVGKVPLPDAISGRPNRELLHQVVVAQLANRRRGTSQVKNRHAVSGSTRKIYRQKGTGRARHGDIKAPIFVGGGQAFGPKARSWRVELPQEIRRGGLRAALADKGGASRLWIFEEICFDPPKTSKARTFFETFEIAEALVCLDRKEGTYRNVERSVRNLSRFRVCPVESLSVTDVVRFEHLIVSRPAWDRLVGRIAE